MNNDFKQNYKDEMDKIVPSSESIEKLTDALTEKRTRRISPKALRRVIALAACIALVVAAAVPIGLSVRDEVSKAPSPSELVDPQKTLDRVTLTSYDEIFEVVSAARSVYTVGDVIDGLDGIIYENEGISELETGAPTSVMPTPAATGNDYLYIGDVKTEETTDTPEFSDTNLQEAGVQEADIIKTDGKYIYALSNKYLHIVKAENGELTLISKISRNADESENSPSKIQEMYVSGDRLITVGSIWEKVEKTIEYVIPEKEKNSAKAKEIIATAASVETAPDGVLVRIPSVSHNFVGYGVEIYDISDRSAPKLVNTLTQDGVYVSSRMIGDVLYLITNKAVNKNKMIITEPATFIPDVDGELLAHDCIYLPGDGEEALSANYLVVSGINTAGEGEVVSSKSLFGYGTEVYCSAENLYVTAGSWQTKDNIRSNVTKIIKFSLDGGKVELVAEGTVPGTVLNQFSLDEEDGYLRLVTTFQSWKMQEVQDGEYSYMSQTEFKKANCLYVLDGDLALTGKLEELAPNEQIYSARFEGDIAYFVTFRQTDPLFTVDLSDPTAPKILSELKIPGFSDYLHPWSDGLLFGFGKYANPTTGIQGDLKLSMFDVSDKTNVTEAHTLTLYGNSYSSASYNHKAILVNSSKNIIAFPSDTSKYLVYSYDEEKGFEKEAEIHISGKLDYYAYYNDMRGLFIGDYLYVFSPVGIASYDMNDYSFKASVNLE